jgi:hypothetical protein
MIKPANPLVFFGLLAVLAIAVLIDAAKTHAQQNTFSQHAPTTLKECNDMTWQVLQDIVARTMNNRASFFVNFPLDKILPQMCQRGQFSDAYDLASRMEKSFGPRTAPSAVPSPEETCIPGFLPCGDYGPHRRIGPP